jgi:stearoyl-CoA desaturase (delta-9 desaturase)
VTVGASALVDAPTDLIESGPVVPSEVPIGRLQGGITLLILVGPLIGVVAAAISLWGRFPTILDVVLAVVFYAIAGHGVTAGYHRLFAHRSFRARRGIKIALALAGSLAFEGAVISWVANHRRHHAYTDRPGDPHSPYLAGDRPWSRLRGAVHAHVGWLFLGQPTDATRWAPDLVADPDLVVIDRLFPLLCVVSLGAPTLIGWAITGTATGALGALIWAGLVRVFVLQHATFAINSACHIWGSRPFRTRASDRATNFAPLAVLAMGENWHNLHHSLPRSARHGVGRGQLDSTARFIRLLEMGGLVSDVRWPSSELLTARRRSTGPIAGVELPADQAVGVREGGVVGRAAVPEHSTGPRERDELSSARR